MVYLRLTKLAGLLISTLLRDDLKPIVDHLFKTIHFMKMRRWLVFVSPSVLNS